MKKVSLSIMREHELYTKSLLLHGNGKLLDYTDDDGNAFRYAQFNTRAVVDCPFRSVGCTAVCYATKGNHVFRSVKESREKSYEVSLRPDFPEMITYTVRTEKQSGRYRNATMIIRIHESGDFYSVQYLRKWVKIWENLENDDGVTFVLYTKSFRFFLMLNDDEADVINRELKSGKLSINLSIDDTTTTEQRLAYLSMIKRFPLCNTYICTEDTDSVQHDNVCDCADCAKCGHCNRAEGKRNVVKIHSASNADMKVYRANVQQ